MSDVELTALLAEHRRNTVDEPGLGAPAFFWRTRCDGLSCEYYAEHPTWFEACAAHEEHLAEILAACLSQEREQVRAERDREWRAHLTAAMAHPHKGPNDTDASMCLAAAKRLDGGYPPGGSNTVQTVARILRAVARLAQDGPRPAQEGERA